MLLVFSAVALSLTGALAVATLVNMQGASSYHTGEEALLIAESGASNAMLRLLRDPTYTGETVAIAPGTVTISVSGTNPKTIIAEGTVGTLRRRVQVVVGVAANNVITLTSWSHID
jgi:hypothetical protein